MATARLCPLHEAMALWPEGADSIGAGLPEAGPDAIALVITGDLRLQDFDANAALARGGLPDLPPRASMEGKPVTLVVVEGDLHVARALIAQASGAQPHLLVLGGAQLGCGLVQGSTLTVRGDLAVRDLLWCDGPTAGLAVHGDLQARVALFTGGCKVVTAAGGRQQARYLFDATRDGPHTAEFSPGALGIVFPPWLLASATAQAHGLGGMVDSNRLVDTLRTGKPVVRADDEIETLYPVARDLCADEAISVANILAVVRSPVVAHRDHTASGWFAQTDFVVCRRHVDEDGDQRDDNVFITVWKRWDFYLSVQPAGATRSLPTRIADALRRRQAPRDPELTLLYRRYAEGVAGNWEVLAAQNAPDAWAACTQAWRGVLDYVRKAVGQHRARYPLHRHLLATVTPGEVQRLSSLPVFTDQYNDWWSSDRNGFWEGDLWVGARQPCMHGGEPWGLAVKLSWANGAPAPRDDEDDAHASYQIDVDEARHGPALVSFTCFQRQSAPRATLAPGAADHIARLLGFFAIAQKRLGVEPAPGLQPGPSAGRTAAGDAFAGSEPRG